MSRKVIVASAKTNAAVRIENFTGTTFADLKNNTQFQSVYGDGSNVEVVINPGNVTLRGDDSNLPEGDFKAFIITKANKAGITDGDAVSVGKAIGQAIKQAQKASSTQQATALKQALIEKINNFFEVDTAVVQQQELADAELQAAILEAKNM